MDLREAGSVARVAADRARDLDDGDALHRMGAVRGGAGAASARAAVVARRGDRRGAARGEPRRAGPDGWPAGARRRAARARARARPELSAQRLRRRMLRRGRRSSPCRWRRYSGAPSAPCCRRGRLVEATAPRELSAVHDPSRDGLGLQPGRGDVVLEGASVWMQNVYGTSAGRHAEHHRARQRGPHDAAARRRAGDFGVVDVNGMQPCADQFACLRTAHLAQRLDREDRVPRRTCVPCCGWPRFVRLRCGAVVHRMPIRRRGEFAPTRGQRCGDQPPVRGEVEYARVGVAAGSRVHAARALLGERSRAA